MKEEDVFFPTEDAILKRERLPPDFIDGLQILNARRALDRTTIPPAAVMESR